MLYPSLPFRVVTQGSVAARRTLGLSVFPETSVIRHKNLHILPPRFKKLPSLSGTVCAAAVTNSSSAAGSPSAGVPRVPGARATAGQHGVQRGAALADAAARGDEVGVAALVGEGVSGAACGDTAAERALPPLPVLLLLLVLPTVPLDLQTHGGTTSPQLQLFS